MSPHFVARPGADTVAGGLWYELALKALVRSAGIEPPRTHDVGKILMDQPGRFPKGILAELPRLAEISHDMRRDLELAFYGSEDLTPLEFYGRQHAETARTDATWVVERVEYALGLGGPGP